MLSKWFAVALLGVFGATGAARAERCDFDQAIQSDDYGTERDESIDAVKALLDAGCTLSQHDADELLLDAAQDDDIALARLLIERGGANVNARGEENRAPLHVATGAPSVDDMAAACEGQPSNQCWMPRVRMMKFLLLRGADPNLQDRFGLTPLHGVVAGDWHPLIRVLLASRLDLGLKDNGGQTVLHLAVRQQSVGLTRALLARGADPNVQDGEGRTPLHVAAMSEDIFEEHKRYKSAVLARLLLAHRARPTLVDDEGKTPLHLAGSNDDREVARVLVAAGARIDALDRAGATPLHDAANGSRSDVVELLLRHGAKADRTDQHGQTPLHWFARFPHGHYPNFFEDPTSIRRLQAHGAQVDAPDAAGRTPLFHAVLQGNRASIAEFIARGANIAATARGGISPLHIATYLGETGALGLLLDRGAAIDPRDVRQRTPLHYAALIGRRAPLELLLQRGADRNARDAHGWTPLALAVGACQDEVSALLRKAGAVAAGPPRARLCRTPEPGRYPIEDRVPKAEKDGDFPQLQRALASGAPIDGRDGLGRTGLHWAAEWSSRTTDVELLLAHEADVNATDDAGQTPLHRAALNGLEAAAERLLQAGALPNVRDASHSTPLHLIGDTSAFRIGLAILLVRARADLALRDRLGRTPLHRVCDAPEFARIVAEYLICSGADPTARDVLGWTASEIALVRGWADTNVAKCGTEWQQHVRGADTGPDQLAY